MKKNVWYAVIMILIVGLSSVAADEMKIATFNDWTIELPGGWNGDNEMGLYWEGEIAQFMGRPKVSIHLGAIPVLGKIAFAERVKQHIGCDFTKVADVTVEGIKGFTCTWEHHGKKHYGMFLEEDVSGMMRVINFFDCQAPVDKYPELEKSFISAVKTAKKK